MIYHLFQYFEKLGWDIPGMGLMHYLSFRAMMATVAAVLFSMIAGKRIIRALQRHQIGETVRDLGLQGQIEKKGTPTMMRAVPISGSSSVRAAITRIRKACRVSTLGRLPALSLEDK